MGLDTILYYGTAAAAQAALAPTSAVIKGTSGDAYIVGFATMGGTATDTTGVTLTCPTDPRWDAAGVKLTGGNAETTLPGTFYAVNWLAVRIPIRQGATLICTQDGAADFYTAIYVDYPQFGEPFKARNAAVEQPDAFLTSRVFTAGAALTAFTIAVNRANSTNFQRGKSYTALGVINNGAMTTAYWVGIQNTKWNLATYWPVPLTPINMSAAGLLPLPRGLGTVDGGETQFVHFLSTTADTPVAQIIYAYQ